MDEAHTPFTHHGLASRREDAIPGAPTLPQHSAAAAACANIAYANMLAC